MNKTRKTTRQAADSSRNLARVMLAVAIIEPLFAMPQALEIYYKKDAGSVSLTSWLFYTFTAVIWLYYGYKIKNRPLIVTSILNVTTELVVVIGIVLYK